MFTVTVVCPDYRSLQPPLRDYQQCWQLINTWYRFLPRFVRMVPLFSEPKLQPYPASAIAYRDSLLQDLPTPRWSMVILQFRHLEHF